MKRSRGEHPVMLWARQRGLKMRAVWELVCEQGVEVTYDGLRNTLSGYRPCSSRIVIAMVDATRGEVDADTIIRWQDRLPPPKWKAA